MWRARQQLASSQTGALRAAAPIQVAASLPQRLFAMLYHVYFAPPAFWDIPNYAPQTAAAEHSYLAVPMQVGWHTPSLSFNLVAGGFILALTLAGILFALHDLAAHHLPIVKKTVVVERYPLVVLLAWSAATVIGLLPINITWQRYYLPLVPIACLWAACGLIQVLRPFVTAFAARRVES